MTLLRRICFSLAICVATLGCASGAEVRGNVEIVSGARGGRMQAQNMSDILIWLQPTHGTVPPPATHEHARLLQKNKMFTPHVLPIRLGTLVDFPNADPIFHNAFSNYDGQLFDLALYPPGTSRSVQFRRAGVVRVFCNIHPDMSAVIVVLETPYFTRASADGSYVLPQVPAGSYELHVFDERAATHSEDALPVTVGDSEATMPLLHISEAGYAQMPHKNKYGHDYGPVVDTYSGMPR